MRRGKMYGRVGDGGRRLLSRFYLEI